MGCHVKHTWKMAPGVVKGPSGPQSGNMVLRTWVPRAR